jgi:molybdenum cofactor cytidylyltransferase
MQGRNKLLVEIDGVPMIRRVVQAALQSKVDEVIVVLGWEQKRIRAALARLPCRTVVNRNYEEGQSSSVKIGLANAGASTRAVMILPGDVTMIDTRSINMVAEKYLAEQCNIIVAAHQGKAGHPILFDRKLFPEIERINEATFGIKAVVRQHQTEVCMVETGSTNVLKDIDTNQDLKELFGQN